MSRYVAQTVKTFEFDGDTVTVVFKPLSYGDMLALRAIGHDEVKFFAEAGRILPAVVSSLSGLRDAAGNDVTLATVIEQGYFAALVGQIIAAMVSASVPGNPQPPAA